jgi:hypothetical protein
MVGDSRRRSVLVRKKSRQLVTPFSILDVVALSSRATVARISLTSWRLGRWDVSPPNRLLTALLCNAGHFLVIGCSVVVGKVKGETDPAALSYSSLEGRSRGANF